MRNTKVVRPLEVDGEEVGHEDNEVIHVVVERAKEVKRVDDALVKVVGVPGQCTEFSSMRLPAV